MDKFPQFGLIVAYLIPGFIGLAGIAPLVPAVGQWLQPVNQGDMGFGPPIYALLAATGVGMIVSCVRWFLIDHMLYATGLRPPKLNFANLEGRLEAFNFIVEGKYRYFQFYSNMCIAVLWAYLVNRAMNVPHLGIGIDLGVLILCAVLLAGSRDALANYYSLAGQLVGEVAEKDQEGDAMTNGFHHEEGSSSKQKPEAKSALKPAKNPKPQQPAAKDRKADK